MGRHLLLSAEVRQIAILMRRVRADIRQSVMNRVPVPLALAMAMLTLGLPPATRHVAAQASIVQITSPQGRIASTGLVRIVAQIRTGSESSPEMDVDAVRFYVDNQLVGEDRDGPVYAVQWADKNPFAAVSIRAEAVRADIAVGVDSVTLPPLDITDESRIASVLLDVSVLDEQGRYVRELTREHFAVYEDGQTQTIELMDAALVPTTHTLLVDTSNSMSYRFDFVRRVARRMGSSMKPNDQMVVLPFASTLGPMTGPTTDLAAIASAVESLESKGGTAIADAIIATSDRADHRRLRRTEPGAFRSGHGGRPPPARHALHHRHQRRRRRVDPRP
jgi:hypothetical protein